MANPHQLTPAQQSLLDTRHSVFVEACPGAGKTETIVTRYVQRAREQARKGIALVSFTNAAVDEVRARCSDSADLLRPPHFVGTFDSFINRYLTIPLYAHYHGVVPTFVDSWKSVLGTGVRCCDELPRYMKFDLEWFSIQGPGRVALDDERIGGTYFERLKQHADSCRTLINDEGSRIFKEFRSQHMLSCSASRAYAERALRDGPMREKLGTLLANRFAELIVDEAQDCGPEEIACLKLFKECGIDLVMVADLDQAIYEFRRAVPEEVAAFAMELASGTRLDGNFRSSQIICDISVSVRGREKIRDVAIGRNRDVPHSVQLVSYSRLSSLPTTLGTIFDKFSLDRASCMVLAYKWADARTAAGALSRDFGQSIVGCIASAAVVLQQADSVAKARKDAIDSVELAILKLCRQAGIAAYKLDQHYESAGLSRRWFRDLAVRMALHRNPLQSDAGEYAKAMREFASKVTWPPTVNISKLSDSMKAVAKGDWDEATKPDSRDRLPCSSIHGVKGSQFPGVAVVVPRSLQGDLTFLDDWYSGEPVQGERRRILYVGVSRAEKVLVLAIHRSQIERVEATLRRDQVDWERWNGD